MLHKFMNSIRQFKNHSTGFDTYLINIQRSGQEGSVTVDEAKKDYRRALSARDRYYIGG